MFQRASSPTGSDGAAPRDVASTQDEGGAEVEEDTPEATLEGQAA